MGSVHIGLNVSDGMTGAKVVIRDKDNVVVDKFWLGNFNNFAKHFEAGNKVSIEVVDFSETGGFNYSKAPAA